MSSSIIDWTNYFEAALLICCKTASYEYQINTKPKMPDYSEYQNAVIEHIDGLKKARIDEYVENQKEKDNIELAAKNVIDRIRKGEEEFIKILVESYEELKRLSMVFPYKYIV